MEHIWAPWRMELIAQGEMKGCFFCEKSKEDRDAENYVLYRGEKNFIILNAYPYTPGHLMVATYRHIASLDELTGEELGEHFEMVRKSAKLLKETFDPAGFNIGLNLGKVAGAGIKDHLHTHIVPRWEGDTNFMTTIAATRVLPEALASTYQKMKAAIDKGF